MRKHSTIFVFVLLFLVSILWVACPKPELPMPVFKNITQGEIAKIILEWERNYEADYYDLYFSDSENGEFSLLSAKIEDSRYVDESDPVKKGVKRYYKLVSVDIDVTGALLRRSAFSESATGESIGYDPLLTAVGKVSAKVLSTKTNLDPVEDSVPARFQGVYLAWDVLEKADFYGVWRSVDGGEFVRVLHLNDKGSHPLILIEPNYSDFTLESGHSYQYQIRPLAVNKADPSQLLTGDPSAVVSISMPVLKTTVSWTSAGVPGSIMLSWSPIATATAYRWNQILGDSIRFVYPTESGDPIVHTETGLDQSKSYTYVLYASIPVEILVDNAVQADVPVATYVFDTGKNLTVSFFEEIAALTATQGTADKITLKWKNTPDLSIKEFDIYRQKLKNSWFREGDSLSFPEKQFRSVSDIEAQQVNLFQNNSFEEQGKLLFLGSTSALDSGGGRLTDITYVDESRDLQRMHPGLYRYYIVAGRSFISTTAYRSITDKEFLQVVSRELDRAMSNLYGGKPGTLNSSLGGTFSVKYESNVAGYFKANYHFNNFKMPLFTFHTPDPKGVYDESVGKYQFLAGYYSERFGTLEVSGLYSGEIKYHLPRNPKSAEISGGADFAPYKWARTEKELNFSSSNRFFLGWWDLTRSGNPTQQFRWDNGETEIYENSGSYDQGASRLEPMVEPNFDSDYIKWE